MNVAIVTHFCDPEPCAASNRVGALARALTESGHRVTIVTKHPTFPDGRVRESDRRVLLRVERMGDVDVVRLATVDASSGLRRACAWLIAAFLSSAYVLLTRRRFDAIIVTTPPITLALPAIVGKLRHRCRLVTDVRDVFPDVAVAMGTWEEASLLTRAVAAVARTLYSASDWVAAVTPSAVEAIAARGVQRDKLMLAPNGFEGVGEMAESVDHRERFSAVYAGNLGLATGIDVVLDAAGKLRDEPFDITIVGDGVDAARVRRRVETENLRNVHLMGALPRADAMDVIRACDAAVVPLRDGIVDSIPTKIFDALAIGRPVVVCARGEAADLVRKGACGLVVDPSDSDALADALRTLARSPQTRRVMAANGHALVKNSYDRRAIMRRFAAALSA